MKYDLAVIGSGPAGQKGAIAAAKLGKRVAIIEREQRMVGGVCLHTGTIPSKTMREAILHLTGYRQRDVYGDRYRKKRQITMDDLRRKLAPRSTQFGNWTSSATSWSVTASTFSRAPPGSPAPTKFLVARHDGDVAVNAEFVLIASGTRPSRPSHIPFDGECVFDSDEILKLAEIPHSLIVVGGGVIGIEYGLMFATLGVQVTVVDGRERILEFCDTEIIDTLLYHARSLGMTLRFGENVVGIEKPQKRKAVVHLESGKRLVGERVLFSVGREGDTGKLNLPAAELEPDERGRLWCNDDHQTWVPHIYGVGDVVGFPALASVSMEQGRRAVCPRLRADFLGVRPYAVRVVHDSRNFDGRQERAANSQKTVCRMKSESPDSGRSPAGRSSAIRRDC